MQGGVQLTVRHPGGQCRIQLAADAGMGQLRAAVAAATGIPEELQELRAGYPPLLLEGEEAIVPKGGALIVSRSTTTTATPSSSSSSSSASMVRRVVPANNSCLFLCFTYCLMNKSRSLDHARQLRRVVADTVRKNPLLYSDAYLGKDPATYCSWIVDDNAWGGAIDVAILAEHFGTEICCWDVQSKRFDLYQCGGATRRAYFIYDGIHYDPLAMAVSEDAKEALDQTLFDCSEDTDAFRGSRKLCEEMHSKHLFTDTSKFSLRCLVCGKGLQGEDDATKHAKETRHTNFAEFEK